MPGRTGKLLRSLHVVASLGFDVAPDLRAALGTRGGARSSSSSVGSRTRRWPEKTHPTLERVRDKRPYAPELFETGKRLARDQESARRERPELPLGKQRRRQRDRACRRWAEGEMRQPQGCDRRQIDRRQQNARVPSDRVAGGCARTEPRRCRGDRWCYRGHRPIQAPRPGRSLCSTLEPRESASRGGGRLGGRRRQGATSAAALTPR